MLFSGSSGGQYLFSRKGSELMLRPRQKRFADRYIETNNATQAYIEAGYVNVERASMNGHSLLRNANIRAYIDNATEKLDKQAVASRDEVLQFLTTSMRGELDEEVVVAFKSHYEIVKKKIAPRDRLKAAEMLAKRYGLLSDNVSLNFGAKAKFAAVWAEIESDDEDTTI
jgi:phage terminase small subunit